MAAGWTAALKCDVMGETAALLALLQRHYIKPGQDLPGGVFVSEVGLNGGWGAGSRCDAIYVGFTTTSGRLLVGHELKTSRDDWLHELNKPGKADAWADQCHEWWLVVSNPAIVRDGELPAGWGLMSPGFRTKTRMTVHTKADRKDRDHRPSWDAVRSILARQDTLRSQTIHEIRQTAREAAWADVDRRVEDGVAMHLRHQPEATVLEQRIKAIESALGAPIDWAASEQGHARSPHCVGLDELALVANTVRSAGSVRTAAQQLAAGYSNPVKNTQHALDRLAAALDELKEAHHGRQS